MDANQAAQLIMQARLTRFFERTDWQQRLADCRDKTPKLMKRRIAEPVAVKPVSEPDQISKPTLTLPLDAVLRDRKAAYLASSAKPEENV